MTLYFKPGTPSHTVECADCQNTGVIRRICPHCKGSGESANAPYCYNCKGWGEVQEYCNCKHGDIYRKGVLR